MDPLSTSNYDGPVFSPTRLKDFVTCPLMSALKRKWEPMTTEWEPNRLLGTALTTGLNVYYKGLRDEVPASDLQIWASAYTQLESGFQAGSRWDMPGLEKILEKSLDKAMSVDMVRGERILVVDESLGKGKPDLVLRRRDGTLRVVDTKFKLRVNPDYAEKNIADYDTDDQMWHYAWEVGNYFNAPVSLVEIHQVSAMPSYKSRVHPIVITPEKVAFWLKGAIPIWQAMENARGTETFDNTPKFTGCTTRYGQCPFYLFCHTLGGNQEQMKNYYTSVEPFEGPERLSMERE
jgi:hypothetical protein